MTDQFDLTSVVDTDRYPLTDPGGDTWAAAVAYTRHGLATVGCSVLDGFIRSSQLAALRAEGEQSAPDAYYDVETVNVYNIPLDTPLPPGHPGRLTMQRGNAFVARDRIDPSTIISQLYGSELLQRFLAECFGRPRLHPLADPLSGLVLNVITPGRSHPWHFDTNEMTVSLLTQRAEAGGVFEYCPNIRSAQAENLDDVLAVLTGDAPHLVHSLEVKPGDLQLFRGRYALHRVSEVTGATARHSAIFAYSEQPGVIGTVARTRQLFGRVAPEHGAGEHGAGEHGAGEHGAGEHGAGEHGAGEHGAGGGRVRGDSLLD